MLIICPECENKISDKSLSCPHCGIPNSYYVLPTAVNYNNITIQTNTPKPSNQKKKNRHTKLPSGMGSIQKLSRRKKKYIAYPPTSKFDYNLEGKLKRPKPIGTFYTYNNAYTALMNWNSIHKSDIPREDMLTFQQIYDRWYEKEIVIGNASKQKRLVYQSAYQKCTSVYDKPMVKIFTDDIQQIIDDNSEMSYSTKSNIKGLFSKLYKYGISNGLLSINYASYVDVGKNTNKKGTPLEEDVIKRLWEHSDDEDVQVCLIYIYSGLRLNELNPDVCTIDLKERTFKGGLKTDDGKNRVVPIHPLIYDFVKNFNHAVYNGNTFYSSSKRFKRVKELCDFTIAPDGENRTPHDFRHTFQWLADKYFTDKDASYFIMGHSPGNDVHKKVYGHRTLPQLKEQMGLIQKW